MYGVVSSFPFGTLPVVARQDVAFGNSLSRWLAVDRRGAAAWPRVERLAGAAIAIRDIRAGAIGDPYCGTCALRVNGALLDVRASNALVRRIAQQVLGGPEELPAPRPLGVAEQAIWALIVAAAVEDLGIAGEVVACEQPPVIHGARELVANVELAGLRATVGLRIPRELEFRVPPARHWSWPDAAMIDAQVVVGRCAIEGAALDALAARTVITLEPALAGTTLGSAGHLGAELVVLDGSVGISGEPGALVAEVVTGYVPRAMALPDDAHVELTVGLGSTQLSLRQVFELAVGQVVPLGRPLAGPFEIRAAGKRVGYGELVNIDGELGVRIVSLEEK